MSDREIEIQVKLNEAAPLKAFLKEKAKFVGKFRQVDEYYTPPHKDYRSERPIAEWLRLRESKTNSITYKLWHYDDNGKSHHCDEYETDIDDIEQMRKIFKATGNVLMMTVDKRRQIWMYKDYEISLDTIAGLGDFVELEYKGKNQDVDPKEITDDMVALLKSIGLKNLKRNFLGYPFMLLFPDEYKEEPI